MQEHKIVGFTVLIKKIKPSDTPYLLVMSQTKMQSTSTCFDPVSGYLQEETVIKLYGIHESKS
jgi:hypothetical protein